MASGLGGRSNQMSVAIDPVALVVTECITVTSAMRKHARWAHSSISSILGTSSSLRAIQAEHSRIPRSPRTIEVGDEDGSLPSRWGGLRGKKGQSLQDNPLIAAFARLRADLKSCNDIECFDTPSLLQPFLQVIRSSSTTAPITSLALIAITKMLAYNIINPQCPNFGIGMQLLASSVTHCRFEGDNTASDEVVFLRILKLMEHMVCGPSGNVLGDQSVCEMMECALSICCHLRMTEVLRRSGEISMVTMCQTIFTRLKDLETAPALDDVGPEEMEAAKIDSSPNGAHGPNVMQRHRASLEVPSSARVSTDAGASQLDLSEDSVDEVKPYGLPSIRELFRVLADLLDPHDRQRTDTLRVMALRIVNVALEVAGPSIANHPNLASLAKDTLCRNLFELVRSENIAILHESLRVAGTLLATCRGVLKLQQELFLSYIVACLHPRVPIPEEPGIDSRLYQGVPQAPALVKPQPSESGRSTPIPVRDRQKLGMEGGARKPDAREAMVESVGGLVRIPSFMAELFVNYDCEIDRSDLCTDMVGLLARNAFPDAAIWSTTNVPPLCLDSLLGYVQSIWDRLDDEPNTAGLPDAAVLREQRNRKKIVIRGATMFNENPKGGIAYLASQGIIEDPDDPRSITRFLKGTARIDKTILGDFISKRTNEHILEAFLDDFDFTGLRVDEALRQLLHSFRLPGESALIERIVTVFIEKYLADAKPDKIATADAGFVLTYAIIMLNTDLYNPNIRSGNRMTQESFSKNLRGVNDNADFDPEFLQDIYNAIKSNEIILPEEHDNKHAFEYAWKELLAKAQTVSDLVICDTNIYDADMFAATWRPIIAALNYVFASATENAVFQRVMQGYDQCAMIAARYGLSDCVDHIVHSLAEISTLAKDQPDTSLNTEVQASGRSIMVSKFAVDFGRGSKAQLATIVLFRIINGNEQAIDEGWMHIVRIIINLFVNSLIPTSFTSISRDLDLPPIPLQSPAQIIARHEKAGEGGLFSAFTSYVSSVMNDEPPEPNDEEIEATKTTVECINDCRFEEILGNVSELPVESLKSLTRALLSQLPESSSPRVITVKPEVPTPRGPRPLAEPAVYDPAKVYVLELATILALRDEDTIASLGADTAAALQTAINDSERIHPVALGRIVFYLLSLLRASNDHKYIRTPVVLHAISSIRPDLLSQCSMTILKGIYSCVSGPVELKNEMATSPDFWAVLHLLQTHPEAGALVFQIAQTIPEGVPSEKPASIAADNYTAFISLLNIFAAAGGNNPESLDRARKALSLVANLSKRVPRLIDASHLERKEAWHAYWNPLLGCLTTQATHPLLPIRQTALSSLGLCLHSPQLMEGIRHKEISSNEEEQLSESIFSQVLFPLLHTLLKPEVYTIDPRGMNETRVQAAQLLTRTFLHNLSQLAGDPPLVQRLWASILEIMERLLNSGVKSQGVEEAVREAIKNVLLVMSGSGSFGTTAVPWNETSAKLEKFLPGLMDEVFPPPPAQVKEGEEGVQ
ncbi:Sec7-domain-containing protein [Piedraia hortae CBS 480.64]|uniref:Sec7-domain-containing protein n=1 Tax=Piedraia hortae CBS 480.64 TaxID=1314780 RepID=A0A6A7C0E1_9PEZI|nr:Sec7-domain-containing protein [Piedraia hortae CBS 480.64]